MSFTIEWQAEAIELKQMAGKRIDNGNQMLGLDYVPRDGNGSPIDPMTAGMMSLFRAVSTEYIH